MSLLADLGNTRLKLATQVDGRIVRLIDLVHADADFLERLVAWIARYPQFDRVVLASVAGPGCTTAVTTEFARAGLRVDQVATRRELLGLRTCYTRYEQLGVDRWLALLALHQAGEGPCLAVGMGSALTCDVLTAGGLHLGGVIAPVPEAMRVALSARAPALRQDRGRIEVLSTSTEDGIESGCLLAAVGLIEHVRAAARTRIGGVLRLVLSGGAAESVRAFLPDHRWQPDLVFEGLAHWAGAVPSGLG